MTSLFYRFAALSGMLAVMIGAFSAHGLKDVLSERMLSAMQTGVEYQFYHTLALLAVALLLNHKQVDALKVAGWAFVVGICLFSGSLYLMAMAGLTWLGPVTPIGGVSFILGWAALAKGVWHNL